MKYRPDIDGLRALAVLSVLFYHAGYAWMPGGFLGVDVFFVISGYLITSIIWAEKQAAGFSIANFYERRVRRILPAYFAMLTVATVFAIVTMLPAQLRDYGQSMIASNLFIANFFFWLKLDYWGLSAELTPLVHLWSLGIEEQFYLVFPLLLLALNSTRAAVVALALVVIASFASMVWAISNGSVAEAFYLILYRAWELAAGALLIFLQPRHASGSAIADLLCIPSIAALLACFHLFTQHTAPYLLYGLPILLTCVLIALGGHARFAAAMLGS